MPYKYSAVFAEKYVPENSARLGANDVETGSAPDEPVQIPDFTATDQLGHEVSLEQIKVCSCKKPSHLKQLMSNAFHHVVSSRLHTDPASSTLLQ